MLKKFIYLIALLGVFASTVAQSVPRLTRAANELFENDRYLDATEYYEKIVSLDKRKELFEAR